MIRSSRRKKCAPAVSAAQSCLIEPLEGRQMLSATHHSGPSVPSNAVQVGTRQPNFFNSMVVGLRPADVNTAYGFTGLGVTGAGQTVAIVGAFDAPTIRRDLETFSTEFGLTAPTRDSFQVYYATKQRPLYDATFAAESSLTVQWVHAIAPDAKIILVEAGSNYLNDLNQATDRAVELVHPTGGVVTITIGGSETFADPLDSRHYHNDSTGNVSFVAASGDSGADTSAPGVFPDVTAVGGTFLNLDSSANLLSPEEGWTGSGGGRSSFFARPTYQTGVTLSGTLLDNRRALPDVAMLGDLRSAVAVFDSSPDAGGFSGWRSLGGTSVSAPLFAGFVALANEARANLDKDPIGSFLNPALYSIYKNDYAANFNDITKGTNGFPTYIGYDLVTGLGSPKPALITALANDNSSVITSNLKFQAARLKLESGLSSEPPTQVIFGGAGAASKSGSSWDLSLTPNVRSGVSLALDGPLTAGSRGRFFGSGILSVTLDNGQSTTNLLRVVAREDADGNLFGEFYAVSSRGRIIMHGDKPAFYGTFPA